MKNPKSPIAIFDSYSPRCYRVAAKLLQQRGPRIAQGFVLSTLYRKRVMVLKRGNDWDMVGWQ